MFFSRRRAPFSYASCAATSLVCAHRGPPDGFVGHFVGKERGAVATGTVTVDGRTLVDGTSTNASIETLEDANISLGE